MRAACTRTPRSPRECGADQRGAMLSTLMFVRCLAVLFFTSSLDETQDERADQHANQNDLHRAQPYTAPLVHGAASHLPSRLDDRARATGPCCVRRVRLSFHVNSQSASLYRISSAHQRRGTRARRREPGFAPARSRCRVYQPVGTSATAIGSASRLMPPALVLHSRIEGQYPPASPIDEPAPTP